MRLFFVEHELGTDPQLALSTSQKMAAVACVLLLQSLLAGLFFVALMTDSEWLHATSTQMATSIAAASLARPALLGCDYVFRRCALLMRAKLKPAQVRNDMLFSAAALHCTMDLDDLLSCLRIWGDALLEITVRHVTQCTWARSAQRHAHPAHLTPPIAWRPNRIPNSTPRQ